MVATRGFVLAAALGVASAADCGGNFMFGGLLSKLGVSFPATSAVSSDSFCPMYANKDSCCSSAMSQAYSTLITEIDAGFGMAMKKADDLNADEILAALKVIEKEYPGKVPPELAGLTDDEIKPFVNVVLDVVPSLFKCARGAYGEVRGLLCFSCEPEWDKYLTAEPAPGTLTLASSSCTGLFKTCKPLISSVNKAKNKAIDIAVSMAKKAFGGSLPAEATAALDKAKDLDMCDYAFQQMGTTCQAGVCAYLGDPINQILSLAGKIPNHPPSMHGAVLHAMQARTPAHAAAETLSAVLHHARDAVSVMGLGADAASVLGGKANSGLASGSGSGSGTGSNGDGDTNPNVKYSESGGYKAFAAGCAVQTSSDTNCDVGGDGGSLGAVGGVAGLIGIIAGVVVGVALVTVIAVVVVRRKRNNEAPASYQPMAPNAYYAQPPK